MIPTITWTVPYVADRDFTLWLGDVREVLPQLAAESVDCVATSPPFYALRDYGVEGQIGLEETPERWVEELVGVFRECRRLLRPGGTLWVECGDSYNSATSTSRAGSTLEGSHGYWENPLIKHRINVAGVKPKDLLGTPWLLAFALRQDGWWLRQCIVWHKPNAMPESATDRCTTAHSYLFLLSKSARYWFDAEAIAEPAEWARWGDQTVPKYEGTDTASGWMQPKTKRELTNIAHGNSTGRQTNGVGKTFDVRADRADGLKNARSVWTVPTQGYPEAHFATWPEALVERILKAGCPQGGTVLDPFMGSGTTALVARKLGRNSVGIELNPDYAKLAAKRLSQLSLLAEAPSLEAAQALKGKAN